MIQLDIKLFKNASGSWLSKALFFETTDADKSKVLYTLKPEDHTSGGKTYPSIRRLYLELGDDTEFYFAKEYFGGWPHWKRLLTCTWFVEVLEDIREELRTQRMADARRRILEIAKDKTDKGSLQANRLILDSTKKAAVGRPSKAAIKEEANKLFKDAEEISDDLERILSSTVKFPREVHEVQDEDKES